MNGLKATSENEIDLSCDVNFPHTLKLIPEAGSTLPSAMAPNVCP